MDAHLPNLFHFTGAAWPTRSRTVPIRPFLDRDDSFGPEDIAKMSAALEAALGKLGLVGRSDPVTMAVAKLIHRVRQSRRTRPRAAVCLGVAAIIKVSRPRFRGTSGEPMWFSKRSPHKQQFAPGAHLGVNPIGRGSL
jgi:hypothetical protein